MTLVVKKTIYEKATEGLHNATVSKVEDLGNVETKNGVKHRIRIDFTCNDQKDKEGRDVVISQFATASLGKKATLTKILSQLGFTNVGAEFDVEEIVGIKCQIVVEHVESEGEVYANIASILKVKKTTATEV